MSILATKLYIPLTRPKVVGRSRLIQQLNNNLHRKLTLVSAPAGFGKTTLVSEWLSNCKCPAAWLSLDKRDNDLNRFLAYVVAALQTLSQSNVEGIRANFGEEVLSLLQSPPPVPTQPVLTTLLNELTTFKDKFILVLDDYHLIDALSVNEVVDFLLAHLPPQMHLAIISREDPELRLARLRAQGQLTELRADDLRFTVSETAVFLNQIMNLNLSNEALAALEQRTEGWIAGLQLAALALQGTVKDESQQGTAAFLQSFTGSHRFVLDYLVEEVLQQQPEKIQAFLQQTSILNHLSAPLCAAILETDRSTCQAHLEYLERANLLVVPLDNQQEWYRYHHLFADALQARLQKEQPDLLPILHQRACSWHIRHGQPAEAIHHALAAKDFATAADLIELTWSEVRRSCFQSPTWLAWVKALPEEQLIIRPVLCVGYAWELLNYGELQAAKKPLDRADQLLAAEAGQKGWPDKQTVEMVIANQAEFASLRATLATVRGYFAHASGDAVATLAYAQQALTLISETDFYTRGIASMLLGFAQWADGDLENAFQTMSDSMESMQQAGNVLYAISATSALADIRMMQGRLYDAIHVYQRGLQLATAQGESIRQGTADIYLGLAELHYEQGERERASQLLKASQDLGQKVALPHWPFRLCLLQARIQEGEGDFAGALAQLDEAESVYYPVPIPVVRPIAARKAKIWLRMGRHREAWGWLEHQGVAVDDDLHLLNEFEHIVLARALVARYEQDSDEEAIREAEHLLERLLNTAANENRKNSVVEILIVQTLAHRAQADQAATVATLANALKWAEPEGCVQIFLDEGKPLTDLLPKTASHEVSLPFLNKLMAMVTGDQQQTAVPPTPTIQLSSAVPSLIEPLTPREQEVLQLLVAGRSNPEIAQQLVIAVTTVKTHVKNLYGKLQVKNRSQAVARAKELNLA